MTLLELEVIIHYGWSPRLYPNRANATLEAELKFQRLGLIKVDHNEGPVPQITDKGQMFLEMLKETPMPVKKWADPRKGNEQV